MLLLRLTTLIHLFQKCVLLPQVAVLAGPVNELFFFAMDILKFKGNIFIWHAGKDLINSSIF